MNQRILIIQLDGALPNLALMRLASYHHKAGDSIKFRRWPHATQIDSAKLGARPDQVYASAIFEKTLPLVKYVKHLYPDAVVGGTGSGDAQTLEEIGIAPEEPPDYQYHPEFTASLGFSQRGCRLRCPFCVVPAKEGAVRATDAISAIWRGEPWPRHIVLLDNDFFGQPGWAARIDEMNRGGFRVNFTQGINVRTLTDEQAAALASVDYRDTKFKTKRLYTAWDNRKDEDRLFVGLERLVRHGVRPDHIMVYMLVGYWPGETAADRDYRRRRLREFGARPYPMPYFRTQELVGFQRWIVGAYDKRTTWAQWEAAQYDPRKV